MKRKGPEANQLHVFQEETYHAPTSETDLEGGHVSVAVGDDVALLAAAAPEAEPSFGDDVENSVHMT